MCQNNSNIIIKENKEVRKKYSRLTQKERHIIEYLFQKGYNQTQISEEIGRNRSVVCRELKRHAKIKYKDNGTSYLKYTAAEADGEAKFNHKKAGRKSKIQKDIRLKTFIENKIKSDKWSPEEVCGYIKVNNIDFKEKPNFQNIYYWIDTKQINITNFDLPHRKTSSGKKEKVEKEQHPSRAHKSIHLRPKIVDENTEFGNWEMDCVEGNKNEKEIYLTLLERKTKKYIAIKMKDSTTESVVRTWDILESKYGKYFKEIFKTITTDNGRNFIRYDDIEKSRYSNEKRFDMYYTDPYSAWQKGMNENCNGLLRRFIPKGSKIANISEYELEVILYKINNKPRKILGFRKADDLFNEEISNIIKVG